MECPKFEGHQFHVLLSINALYVLKFVQICTKRHDLECTFQNALKNAFQNAYWMARMKLLNESLDGNFQIFNHFFDILFVEKVNLTGTDRSNFFECLNFCQNVPFFVEISHFLSKSAIYCQKQPFFRNVFKEVFLSRDLLGTHQLIDHHNRQ